MENILEKQGHVTYQPQFVDSTEGQTFFDQLKGSIPWREEGIVLFGKRVMQPRLFSWHADSGLIYKYSGLKLEPQPWTSLLTEIKHRVEEETSHSFNSVLLNLYRNEKDSNGWHSDDERELGKDPVIASLSLGEARDFLLKHKKEKNLKHKICLVSGSLLVMSGATQAYWKHCLPKRTRPLGPRINLTFRKIL